MDNAESGTTQIHQASSIFTYVPNPSRRGAQRGARRRPTCRAPGTTPNNLEGSGGLASGLGGFAVHSLLFAGPEVMAEVSSGGNSLVLQEAYSSSSPTNWVSHPTGIGYRRPAPANGGLPANSGNGPITDSGTADGSNDQELARLTNFDTGGNENSTATQTAPTSRAEQQGGVATGTGTGPSGTDANGGDGGYYK